MQYKVDLTVHTMKWIWGPKISECQGQTGLLFVQGLLKWSFQRQEASS